MSARMTTATSNHAQRNNWRLVSSCRCTEVPGMQSVHPSAWVGICSFPAELCVAGLRLALIVAVVLLHGATDASAQAPPSPWQSTDIGDVGFSGSDTVESGTFAVTGSGADIWSSADQFHFSYVELPYDGYLQARVTGIDDTHAWAKAGVMIRQSLDPNARHDSFFITPGHRAVYQHRDQAGGPSYNSSLAPHAAGAPL
jgi:hypothetical protein